MTSAEAYPVNKLLASTSFLRQLLESCFYNVGVVQAVPFAYEFLVNILLLMDSALNLQQNSRYISNCILNVSLHYP